MHSYEMPLSERDDPALDPAEVDGDAFLSEPLLRENAAWFCQIRWMVVVSFAAFGVASMFPLLAYANVACCLWAWVGGGLAALLQIRAATRPPKVSEAAFVGLAAGLVATLMLTASFHLAIQSPEQARAVGEQLSGSAENRQQLEELDRMLPSFKRMREELLAGRPSAAFPLFALVVFLFTLPHFAAAGAIVTTLYLRRRPPAAGLRS